MADGLGNTLDRSVNDINQSLGLNTGVTNDQIMAQIKSTKGVGIDPEFYNKFSQLPDTMATVLNSVLDKFMKAEENKDKTVVKDGAISSDLLNQLTIAAGRISELVDKTSRGESIWQERLRAAEEGREFGEEDIAKADYNNSLRSLQSELSKASQARSAAAESGDKDAYREATKNEAAVQGDLLRLISRHTAEISEKTKEKQREEEDKRHKGEIEKYFIWRKQAVTDEDEKAKLRHEGQEQLLKAVVSALGNLATQINTNLVKIAEYRGDFMTRLNGIGKSWDDVSERIEEFGLSSIVNEQTLMENINRYAKEGYAYNIEQRAFLNTIKDDIATTFNAFDASLLRLERIQQQDSSVARMGMEAALTKYLNAGFEDSSYMNSLFGTVRSNLLEAESTMTKAAAAEFEFAVQKWLGAMYSVGVDQSVITKIAQGLGQLGSGNVNIDNANQSLFAMAANRSGQDYSALLTDGLNASNVNVLLGNVVEYLKQMTSDNNVLTNAIGNVFGVGTSSMMALQNLDTASIIGDLQAYSDMTGVTRDMYSTIGGRIGLAQQMQNVLNNFKYNAAVQLGENQIISSMYQMLYNAGGLLDTAIPTISAMGFGVSFEGTKVSDILKAAMGGLGLISGLVGGVNAITGGTGFTGAGSWLDEVGGVESQGGGLGSQGALTTTSKRTVANTASSDLTRGAQASAVGEAEQTQGAEVRQAPEATTDDLDDKLKALYEALFIDQQAVQVNLNNSATVASTMSPIMAKNIRNQLYGAEAGEDVFLSQIVRDAIGEGLTALEISNNPLSTIDNKMSYTFGYRSPVQ